MRTCRKCNKTKTKEFFYTYSSWCKKCHNNNSNEWRKKNPEKRKEILKRYKESYFIKKCKICSSDFIQNSQSKVCSLKCRILDDIKIKLDTGCWEWIKGYSGMYGKVRIKYKTMLAHRASYIAFKGQIPEKMLVCHKCDNPKCVNPEHLFLGTQKDNINDAIKKGRVNYKGINNRFCKLSENQIEEIIKLKEEGFTYQRLSKIFNCTITHIWNVIKKKSRCYDISG